jgi:ABC-2 type transport system ATP-binding protein
MIQIDSLTKSYGPTRAVDHLSFTVEPGYVTGFLGPNGAGKSTTMRCIVGLDAPTSGSATVNGRRYAHFRAPLTEVGGLLDAKAVHPGRTGRNHVRALAQTHGISRMRADYVLDQAGLGKAADKRAGKYSLGMSQRLGIAVALLGDPATVILDEPVNGLDPEGVAWVRDLAKTLAREGRTVFLSSHLMSEMAQTADHLIIIGKGRLIANTTVDELVSSVSGHVTRMRSPQAGEIALALAGPDVDVKTTADGALEIHGMDADSVGKIAAQNGWIVQELAPVMASLETAYMNLTDSAVEYRSMEGALR